jgi:hypothetical protein
MSKCTHPWSWLQEPRNGRGYLRIGGTLYQVTEQEFEHESGWGGWLADLMKPDGTTYRIVLDRDGDLTCDCPDAVYRDREHCCKHARAVREAFDALDRTAVPQGDTYHGEPPF